MHRLEMRRRASGTKDCRVPHGLQLWRRLTQHFDPALEGNFIGESMRLMAHTPVKLEQLSAVICLRGSAQPPVSLPVDVDEQVKLWQ